MDKETCSRCYGSGWAEKKMEEELKTNFAWASIAGADPEPVEMIERDNRKGLLTIGCQDPFWLDDEAIGIVIYGGNPLLRPKNPETTEQRDEREAKYNEEVRRKRSSYEWHREHSECGVDCVKGCSYSGYVHGWRGAR